MIGEKIKVRRKEKGLTLSELANRTKVSKSYLSYIERDLKKNPSIDVLKKLSSVLDLSIEELINEQELYNEHSGEHLDEEWLQLLQQAIKSGITKEEFKQFQDFVKYKAWSNEKDKG
ncbi:helix-turn-helix domain-containing protein [Thalassorhabdus alkalitolerans]|uniref:Helix-turn-helix domain-containing protein n=1 Tax=Thalassorhabdus alkalitolerans TaxID=2282697 RepID=A0ABW0YL58_9BACI|nr:helix-turn-helix domain-containing protein [Thalassobacillus sp. C254]